MSTTTTTITQPSLSALTPLSQCSDERGWKAQSSSRYAKDDAYDSGYESSNPRPQKSRRTATAPSGGPVRLPSIHSDAGRSTSESSQGLSGMTSHPASAFPSHPTRNRYLPPRTPPPPSHNSTISVIPSSNTASPSLSGHAPGPPRSVLKRRRSHDVGSAKSRRRYHSAWGTATDDMAQEYTRGTLARMNDRTSAKPEDRIITFDEQLPWCWHGKWDKAGGTYIRDPTEKRTGFGVSRIRQPLDKLKSKKNCSRYADMFLEAGIDTLPVSRRTLQTDFPISYLVSTGQKSKSTLTASELKSWEAEKETMLSEKLVDADSLSKGVPVYDLAGELIPGATTAFPSLCTANIDLLLADNYMGGDLGQQAAEFVSLGLTMIAKDKETRNGLVDNGRHWRTVNGKDGKGQRIPRMEDSTTLLGTPISKFEDRDYSKYNPDHCGTLVQKESDFAAQRSKLRNKYLSHLESEGYIDQSKLDTDISNLSFTSAQWDTEFPGLGKKYSDYSEYAAETRSKASEIMLQYLRRHRKDPRRLDPEKAADLRDQTIQHFAAHFKCTQATLDQAKEAFPTIGSTSYSALQNSTRLSEDERRAVETRFMLEQIRWQGIGGAWVDKITEIKNSDLPPDSEVESAWKQANATFAKEIDSQTAKVRARVKYENSLLVGVNSRFRTASAKSAAERAKR